MTDQKVYYNSASGKYDADFFTPTIEASRRRFKKMADLLPATTSFADASAIELGCGTGIYTELLAREAFKKIVSSDISQGMLDQATEKVRAQANVSFQLFRAEEIPFADQSFDFAFSFACLHHVDDPARALGEIHRVLKDKGCFLVMEPNPLHPMNALLGVVKPVERGMLHSWRSRWIRLAQAAGLRHMKSVHGTFFPGKPRALLPIWDMADRLLEWAWPTREFSIFVYYLFQR